jgi:hypothetical protein
MVTGNYRDLFVVIATSSATLIGLLFVALSISEDRTSTRPKIVRQFRAAASFLAFINALIVTLFGLVPGTNVGIPALAFGVGGLLFTAAGIRRTFERSVRENMRPQPGLVVLLLLVFSAEVSYGVVLTNNAHDNVALANIGTILIVSLLIGIARAWEFVGEWDTGILSSISLLIGPPRNSGEAARPDGRGQPAPGALDQSPDDQQ